MIEILNGKTGFLTMFHLIMSQYLKPGKTQTSTCCCRGRKQDRNTNWQNRFSHNVSFDNV